MAISTPRVSRCSRLVLGAAGALLTAACVAPGAPGVPARQGEPAQNGAAADATYDFHGLLLAPFGTLLKEIPIALHEVLLFHDEAHSAAEVENRDCYAADGTPPRFVGHEPDEYLLCFDHDRLTRVEASVRLAANEAAQVFARACALWLKDKPMPGDGTCEGRDGGITFNARLAMQPGDATAPLTITLSDAMARDAARNAREPSNSGAAGAGSTMTREN